MMKNNFTLFVLALLFLNRPSQAQVILTPFGGSETNADYSTSFSSGEVLVFTISEVEKNITQGFQQPEIHEKVELNIINGIIHGVADNNTFTIEGIEKYPNNTFIVLNRWGDKVYEASPYENDWKGTYKNNPLPAATYYYILYLDENKTEEMHGNLYILNQ